MALGFGSFFATVVITPQWLQQWMGYTATQAGIATGVNGLLAVMTAPLIPRLMKKFDPRLLVFLGLSWLATMSVLRSFWTTDSTFFVIMLPQLLQGVGMTAFFVPITVISLGAVEPQETASAAGILSFARSLPAAMGTSIYTTVWGDFGRSNQNALAGTANDAAVTIAAMERGGLDHSAAVAAFGRQVEAQATMLATEHVFQIIAVAFVIAAATVWLARKPPTDVDTSAAH
jgi:DHA2 family multidrug resistance protein